MTLATRSVTRENHGVISDIAVEDPQLGQLYRVVVSLHDGDLSVDIVLNSGESAPPDVLLYTVDPDGWYQSELQRPSRALGYTSELIEQLPEHLR